MRGTVLQSNIQRLRRLLLPQKAFMGDFRSLNQNTMEKHHVSPNLPPQQWSTFKGKISVLQEHVPRPQDTAPQEWDLFNGKVAVLKDKYTTRKQGPEP